MDRRSFVAASLASSASAFSSQTASHSAMGASPSTGSREFYHLRRYDLQMGPQTALAEQFFSEALIPALTRLGVGPVGAFKLDIGPQTPSYYLLVPGSSVVTLATMDTHLAQDEIFIQAAEPFWAAPATSPAFHRVESSLLLAFEGWPKLVTPASSATKAKRIFQLRTYESPSHAAHVRKVEMFNHGEFEIFQRTGLHPVFFAETLVGSRMPSLTYMLTFADTHELESNWAAFSADPAWKKLSTSPRYAYESIVSNISNLILSPLSASQI
jgi:hypothetical protein